MAFTSNIRIENITTGHVQGIAIDEKQEYMYFSFTTCLLKTDMLGNIIGSVKGLAGHLGCIAFNREDGRVYGSLEFKHDAIGKGILQRINNTSGNAIDVADGFYAAIFNVDKIDRMDMDAETDGIMTAIYLKEVCDDYAAPGHRFGCSGIDGFTFAPLPGTSDGKRYAYVAYGIYGDPARQDNDHQVILRYDTETWSTMEAPLNQASMHRFGPAKPDSKYFVYTGNTTWGIQNLEYDAKTNCLFAAVYRGKKECFPNYPMYVIDLNKAGEYTSLKGLDTTGETLALAEFVTKDDSTGIFGIEFPYGSTGMISLGDGSFLFSRDFHIADSWGTDVAMYRFNACDGFSEQ